MTDENGPANGDPDDELFAEYLRKVDEGQSFDVDKLRAADNEIVDLIKTSEQVEEMAGPVEPGSSDDNKPAPDDATISLQETLPPGDPEATAAHVSSSELASYLESLDIDSFEPIPFGDYRLLEVIGRGGMGVVFRARQRSPDRIVAVKMILAGPLASNDDVQRFQSEVQAAGNLDHPNIVTIFEAGRENGRHFFSMEYVEGIELGVLAKEEKLSDQRIARITSQIADAIEEAHQEGILHRDLKPANILINEDDQPVVTDFGLAKLQASETDITETGETLGTPSYMSPEQAEGKIKSLGVASDVYSIGAVMYYMMVGAPPFRGETVVDTILDVVHSVPLPPTKVSVGRSKELEAICLKCMAKDPAKRYFSARPGG